MPWYFKHLKFRAEEGAFGRFVDEKIWLDGFDIETEPIVAEKIRIGDHRRRFRVTSNLAGKCFFNFREIGDVVDMSVCEQKKLRFDALALEPLTRSFWRIKQDCTGRGRPEIAIRLKDSAAKCLISHAIWLADINWKAFLNVRPARLSLIAAGSRNQGPFLRFSGPSATIENLFFRE